MPTTGKYGKRFVAVDKQWKKDRQEQHEEKGAMGSKHLRLAIALLEEAYGDQMLGAEARKKVEAGFEGVNLDGDQLSTKIQVMKWRTFKGDRDGVFEFALAHDVKEVETELAKLLTKHGGKEKHGPEPRGPGIRKVDDLIEDTWKKSFSGTRRPATTHKKYRKYRHAAYIDGLLGDRSTWRHPEGMHTSTWDITNLIIVIGLIAMVNVWWENMCVGGETDGRLANET